MSDNTATVPDEIDEKEYLDLDYCTLAEKLGLTSAVEFDWDVIEDEETLLRMAKFVYEHDNILYGNDHFLMDDKTATLFRLTFGELFSSWSSVEDFNKAERAKRGSS